MNQNETNAEQQERVRCSALLGGPHSQQEYDEWVQSERERLDREHNVIRSVSQLIGWEILRLERWKPGVVRFHARRDAPGGMEFQMGFARDEFFAAWQLPPNEKLTDSAATGAPESKL